MGKKDKHRKKGKQQGAGGGPFAVPKPPPWPWVGPAPRVVPAEIAASAPAVIEPPVGGLPDPDLDVDDVDDDVDADVAAAGEIDAGPVSHDVPASQGAPVSHDAPVSAARAEGDGETIDMADIADIAPVRPADVHEDAAPSIPPPAVAPRPPDSAQPTVDELTQQIRDLEARLDHMLHERRASATPPPRSSTASVAAPRAPDLDWAESAAPAATEPAATEPAAAPETAAAGPAPGSTAHELLSSEFYLRQWGRAGMRERAEEVDEFGFDPAYEERWRPFIDFLYRFYFRVDAQGVSNIPPEGRCIVVANHAGGPLPYDGLMLRAAIRRELLSTRDLRWLTEDFVFYLPYVGAALNRLGAVRACQENAERLLSRERLIGVFPEGAKGIGKLFGDRYRLQRFGRGGFIRLCLRTGTPIVPCAIVGAEEANPTVYRVESLAKLVGLPYLPVTPTFPALGPLGLLPAPTKWKLRFGAPIRFTNYGPEAADDDLLVMRLAEGVRGAIQDMLSGMLEKRRSIWFG